MTTLEHFSTKVGFLMVRIERYCGIIGFMATDIIVSDALKSVIQILNYDKIYNLRLRVFQKRKKPFFTMDFCHFIDNPTGCGQTADYQ